MVKFEDLISDESVTETIANYLEVPFLDDVFPNLEGLTITWTGEYSDHTKYWTDEIQQAWIKARGPEIERMFGYA